MTDTNFILRKAELMKNLLGQFDYHALADYAQAVNWRYRNKTITPEALRHTADEVLWSTIDKTLRTGERTNISFGGFRATAEIGDGVLLVNLKLEINSVYDSMFIES